MESEAKVFSPHIMRVNKKIKNNLYEIINIVPVKPIPDNIHKHETCNFVPRSDKYYVPKKKNGVKVRTVRDIRNDYEKEMFSYLPEYLEKQKNLIMRKIRAGSSKEEETRNIAKNILKSECPVTRHLWQMIMNINPLDCKYNSKYVLWKGKQIQITGSRGGNTKFICNNDLGKVNKCSLKAINKRPCIPKKTGLLHNSLKVKFRPGPLTKKKHLDISNQRYQFGEMSLVNLPKVRLDVEPCIGKSLTPPISTFIQNNYLFDKDEKISQKWADFSVSVLGKVKNGIPAQVNEDCITFELNYKCQQNRLLMHHDSDKTNILYGVVPKSNKQRTLEESTILSEVKDVVEDILTSVEISLNQDNMYFGEDEPRDNLQEIKKTSTEQLKSSNTKNKQKRKCIELNRLDVTVITIPTTSEPSEDYKCSKSFCNLGCVCESLKCSFSLKRHCGRLECMFHCKCDFSKYNQMDSIDDCSDILPGLVNLDKKLGLKLAKEEQKFHQTVIVTDDKSIHLKSKKRNWKSSKKYAEFYNDMQLKAEINGTRMLSIECVNLDCKDIEPWCMVHDMYKCFCKGKFTEATNNNTEEFNITHTEYNKAPNIQPLTCANNKDEVVELKDVEMENDDLLEVRKRITPKPFCNISKIGKSDSSNILDVNMSTSHSCSRVKIYSGRKYDDDYYKHTNQKISEMEKNDKKLQKKLMTLIGYNDKPDETKASITENEQESNSAFNEKLFPPNTMGNKSNIDELLNKVIENTVKETSVLTPDTSDGVSKPREMRLLNKSKLVAWLESSYKQYKQTSKENLVKLSLEPPKNGKVALYSWEFILNRYREKKNYFLLTKQKPYRIFMAVDIKNGLFENCININTIPLTDVENYPITVKNLLTNANNLKENFCILHGLSFCWELVGSVAKVKERTDCRTENDNEDGATSDLSVNKRLNLQHDSTNADSDPPVVNLDDSDMDSNQSLITNEDFKNPPLEENTELSKWFLMTIVNDFTEIRFYNKGFYVKYDSIIKAINVARISGKTVRLSSQKCNSIQADPQFGIYAVPSKEDYCVFIGPYESHEKLGVETVKNTVSRNIKECTRGTWISTNKLDNIKVIDNPLLYLPSVLGGLDKMVSLENDNIDSITPKIFPNSAEKIEYPTEEEVPAKKIIKPIKIKKSGVYHLSPNKIITNTTEQLPNKTTKNFKTIVLNKSALINPKDMVRSLSSISPIAKTPGEFKLLSEKIKELNKPAEIQPMAEIAPQIKESKEKIPETRKRKFDGGMYVLKPEEINKRSWENMQLFDQPESSVQTLESNDIDVEKYIAQPLVRTKSNVFIISDDDDDESCSYKNIWIVCKNIEKLGWIPGKKDHRDRISFQFPGFKYTDFYSPQEAYEKINQVFFRKVYVPKHITMEWYYVESEAEVEDKHKLSSNDLCSDLVMTRKGLFNKFYLLKKFKKSNGIQSVVNSSNSSDDSDSDDLMVIEKSNILSDLEETSNALEEESTFLLDKMNKQLLLDDGFTKACENFKNKFDEFVNWKKSKKKRTKTKANEG